MDDTDNMLNTYSDVQAHHILYRLEIEAGATDENTEEFNVTERGLDNDEIAELIAFRYDVACFSEDHENDVGSSGVFTLGAGYNLVQDEFLSYQPDILNLSNTEITTKDTDEQGQIFSSAVSIGRNTDDDASGSAAGATGQRDAGIVNYRDLFGSGPYLDSTDDLRIRIQGRSDPGVTAISTELRLSLYYLVGEVEGTRATFGPVTT